MKTTILICGAFLAAACFSCTSAKEAPILNLTDFGAVADDGLDDSQAFAVAMDACRENPGVTLFIAPGVYNYRNERALQFEYEAISGQYGEDVQGHFFKPDAEYVIALNMDGFQDVTIKAHGATLIQEGWYETIHITNAANLTIQGLKLTHKRPPATTGEVIYSSLDYFDVRIDTLLYPYITDKVTGRVHFYDTRRQRIYTGGVKRKELIAPGLIRIHSKVAPPKGDLAIFRHSGHGRAGILIKESSNITLENVTIHSHPGMGVVGHRSHNVTMRNLQVIPPAGMVTSTNTDATHFTSCTGRIFFEGCRFAGQGDDCTNIHNYYWTVYKETGNDVRVTVENADLHAYSLDYPDIGARVALISKETLDPVAYYTVKGVSTSIEEWKVVLTLDRPLEGDPDDYYMSDVDRHPSVDIINCTVRSHMARAFLIKTKDVHIAGNTIQDCTGTAIQLGAEAWWREGTPVENVLIENNWILYCGETGHGRQKGTAICAEVNGVSKDPGRLNKNIVIRNNVIQAVGETAIYISDADGVEITDNDIRGSEKAVVIENSENTVVTRNGPLPTAIL